MNRAPIGRSGAPRRNQARTIAAAALVALASSLAAGSLLDLTRAVASPSVIESEASQIEQRIAALEQQSTRMPDAGSVTALAFLFGAFCALWAQNTRRNPWLWFFLGAVLNAGAVVFLLWKNAQERGIRERK